jgi:hypothetical protein
MFFKTTRGVDPQTLKWYTKWQTSCENSTITTTNATSGSSKGVISRTHRPALHEVYTRLPEAKLGHGCEGS